MQQHDVGGESGSHLFEVEVDEGGHGESAHKQVDCNTPSNSCHVMMWNSCSLLLSDHPALHPLSVTAHLLCLSAVQSDPGSCDRNVALNISWYLRSSVCYNEVFNTPVSTDFSPPMSHEC